MDDDEIPLHNSSIKEFCDRALQLHHKGDHGAFVQFVLNGKDYQDDHPVQIVVDPFQDTVSPREGLQISRDFDSVLGLGTTICVDHDLTVFPVSKHEDTLSKNIHLTHRFKNSTVCLFHLLVCLYLLHTLSGFLRSPNPRGSERLHCEMGNPQQYSLVSPGTLQQRP